MPTRFQVRDTGPRDAYAAGQPGSRQALLQPLLLEPQDKYPPTGIGRAFVDGHGDFSRRNALSARVEF